MSFTEWSAIAEVVSAICVVVSLIYLAVQVRQNTRQIRAQRHRLVRDDYLSSVDDCTRTRENAAIFNKGLNQFSEMSAAEQGNFHSLIHPVMHGFHSIWEMNKVGLATTDDLEASRAQLTSLLITPGGRQWWESFKHIPPPEIVDFIDAAVRELKDEVSPATEVIPWLRPEA